VKTNVKFAFGVGDKLLNESYGSFSVRDTNKNSFNFTECGEKSVFKGLQADALFCLENYSSYELRNNFGNSSVEKLSLEIKLHPCKNSSKCAN